MGHEMPYKGKKRQDLYDSNNSYNVYKESSQKIKRLI